MHFFARFLTDVVAAAGLNDWVEHLFEPEAEQDQQKGQQVHQDGQAKEKAGREPSTKYKVGVYETHMFLYSFQGKWIEAVAEV
jgi:hypothetical protein